MFSEPVIVKNPASPGAARQIVSTADDSHSRTSVALMHSAAKSPSATPLRLGRVAKKLVGHDRGSFRYR